MSRSVGTTLKSPARTTGTPARTARRVLVQSFQPAQLVVEARAGLRVAVGRIQAARPAPVHGGFDVAALLSSVAPGSARRVTIGSSPLVKIATPL